jgi:CAAX prenyl protease-like protein
MANPDQAASPPMLKHAAWVRVLPFLVYLGFLLIADVLERIGVPAPQLRWLYPVKSLAVVATLALYWRHYTELHAWRVSAAWTAASVLVGLLVFILWISLSSPWMQIGTPTGFDPRTGGATDWLLVAVRIAGAALVVPVMEELFWRSFLLRWLDNPAFQAVEPARVGLRSVAIAAVLFGFEHNLWLAGIVAGLAYSLLYMRLRSLWAPILAHAVTNGVLGIWVVMTANWSFW